MGKTPLIAQFDRLLTEEDLGDLEERQTKAPALLRLSSRHHRLARMLAEGFSPGEAAIATGYVSSRVSILQDDPSFKELVSFYRAKVEEQFVGLQGRLADLAETAAGMLQERLEDGSDVDTDELMKIIALGADRTGHGPSSTQKHNVVFDFGSRLDAARTRLKQIEGVAVEVKDE